MKNPVSQPKLIMVMEIKTISIENQTLQTHSKQVDGQIHSVGRMMAQMMIQFLIWAMINLNLRTKKQSHMDKITLMKILRTLLITQHFLRSSFQSKESSGEKWKKKKLNLMLRLKLKKKLDYQRRVRVKKLRLLREKKIQKQSMV